MRGRDGSLPDQGSRGQYAPKPVFRCIYYFLCRSGTTLRMMQGALGGHNIVCESDITMCPQRSFWPG
jgi:hypothetical protein